MDLDVYLVHWNAPKWCVSAVASIRESKGGVRPRIHVIDNERSGAQQLQNALPTDVELIPVDQNAGFAGGANIAFTHFLDTHPECEFVVVGSHDAHVQPEAIARLVGTAIERPTFGVLGPMLTKPGRHAGGTWRGWRASHSRETNAPVVPRDWVSGTLMLVRRACLQDVGGMDPRFGSYVEDVDFCLRAKDAGWEVGIVSDALARGIGSLSSDVTYFVDVNSARLAVKRRGFVALPRLLAQYAYWGGRGLMMSLAVWRPTERRRDSREHAKQHLRALRWLLGHLFKSDGHFDTR